MNNTYTVLIPAYNEEDSLACTLASVLVQTIPPAEVIVVDDCSTDRTNRFASVMGVRVIRTPKNTGNKSVAQQFAFPGIHSEFFLTVDADTTLESDAAEQLLAKFQDKRTGAVCAWVSPERRMSLWERARFIEYEVGQYIYKTAQHKLSAVMVGSGCCCMYRTAIVKEVGGFQHRTIAEDLDLTWALYEHGYITQFAIKAKCYPLDPPSLAIFLAQIDRWHRGLIQNLKVHTLQKVGRLKVFALCNIVEGCVAPAIMLFFMYHTKQWWQLPVAFIIGDMILAGIFAYLASHNLKEVLINLPAYAVVRQVNFFGFARALYRECIRKDRLTTWIKGH